MLSDANTLLSEFLKIPSLCPTLPDATPEDARQCSLALDVAEAYARNIGADRVERFTYGEGAAAVDNLLVHSVWYPHSQRLLGYIGHFDVVPANAAEWSNPPFAAEVVEGNMVGRGAVDMKGGNAAFLVALKQLRENRIPHNVVALFTTDEEWEAENGMDPLLAELRKRMLYPEAFWVGEPSSIKTFGDTIATGRRGSINGNILLVGKSGHTAQPSTVVNVFDFLPAVITALKSINFEDGTEWLEKTNLVITSGMSEGIVLTSIVTEAFRLKFNIRFTGTYNRASLLEKLEQALQPFRSQLEVKLHLNTSFSAPYLSNGSGLLLETLQRKLEEHVGQRAALTHQGGTSDGRFVQKYFPHAEVLEFGPLITTMHQPDEHIPLAHTDLLTTLYSETIRTYSPKRKEVTYDPNSPDLIRHTA